MEKHKCMKVTEMVDLVEKMLTGKLGLMGVCRSDSSMLVAMIPALLDRVGPIAEDVGLMPSEAVLASLFNLCYHKGFLEATKKAAEAAAKSIDEADRIVKGATQG